LSSRKSIKLKCLFSLVVVCLLSVNGLNANYYSTLILPHSLLFNYYSSYPFFYNSYLLNAQLLLAMQQDIELEVDRELVQTESMFFQEGTDKMPSFLFRPLIQRQSLFDYEFTRKLIHRPQALEVRNKFNIEDENVTTTENVGDDFSVGYSYDVALDDFLNYRKQQLQRQVWDSLLTTYDLAKGLSRGDLTKMLSESMGLTIPLPPNPLTSIFGKPEVAINVNGEVNLRIGWRFDSRNLGTVSQFGQNQSAPIFHQDIRVNVSGRIGDKLKLNTDWNTRRVFDYDNKFKVGYEGYDDDIIKLVEVGNVNLPLQSSLIGGGQTLFGIRTDFQFGPLMLKTLLSQRRGQRKFVDVRGGASKQYFQLRAYDFADNHFFVDNDYKPVYNEYFKYATPIIPKMGESLRINDIQVWESSTDVVEQASRSANAVAHATLPPIGMNETYPSTIKSAQRVEGQIIRGNFIRIDSSRYRIDRNLGTLSVYNMRRDRAYAVSYRIDGPTTQPNDDLRYGTMSDEVGERDTLVLKLVYVPNMSPNYDTLWSRMMKNIYSINATNVNISETKINIWYVRQSNDSVDVLEGVPDKLVTIFGVDQVNNSSGAAPPDGEFDLRPPFFDPVRGEITFPSVEPFAGGLRQYFARPEIGKPELAELYTFDDVYDTTREAARRNTARDRFVISGEVSGRQTNRISLGAYNLAPNSVRVSLDGVELREYQDYIIDYFAGTVEIRNQRAMLPNANLKIEYEQHDVFNVSTRTLAGLRGDYNLLRTRRASANLGFTLMHYDQSVMVDRVMLGDEPVSNTMFGFDASMDWDTPWLTRALDRLPFYDTKAPSSMSTRGEWAMMLPTPNKRRSEIHSDNNEPVVYIDNFEGAQRYITLGLNPALWQHSSQPVNTALWENDIEAALFRGKLFWFQYFIPSVSIREVYPNNQSYIQGRSNLSPLIINFDPDMRGIYNRNVNFLDSLNPEFNASNIFAREPDNRKRIWGGFQRLLSTFNTNFDNDNIEYIEIMMKVDAWEPPTAFDNGTRMYIDMGLISEDVIPNATLNTEDGITEANPVPNGIIDAGEDIGIDGINDAQERGDEPVPDRLANGTVPDQAYPFPLNLEDDPARDNYAFNFNKDPQDQTEDDFFSYNNFEGNATVSQQGQFPDTEILNRNNGQTLFEGNSYFTYEVNLLPDPINNSQIVGGNAEARWFLYRIPVRSPSSITGEPLFTNIQYVRVRFEGGLFKGQIAEWRLVGSHWQRISNFQSNVEPNDSLLQIAFVNLWENSGPPDYYTMPPGVTAPRQLNNPDRTQDIRMNEQSIAISVNKMPQNQERMAVRIMRPLDIFFYKKLKFFIHGDGTMPQDINSAPKAYAYIRFGIDSSNYYEYRRPLIRGWQDVEVDLSELTSIKQIRDTFNLYERQVFPVQGDEFAFFAVKGNPILTRVQFFGLGIANPSQSFQELTTTMWVNELRLLSPENSADWGAVGSFNIKLADLGSIDASIQVQQPNFHRLEERFGDRVNYANWTVTMQGNLEKFAPRSFAQMRLPISYTHAEILRTPQYVANNDINLEEAANVAYYQALAETNSEAIAQQARSDVLNRSQSLQVQDSWALTGVKLGIPIKHWLINQTLNNITMGYSYSQEFERSPIYEKRFNWRWLLNLQYALTIPELLAFTPGQIFTDVPFFSSYSSWKVNFLPSNFSAGLNMTRRRQTEQSRFMQFPSPVLRDFTAMRSAGFNWKLSEGGLFNPVIDYKVSTNSTMVGFELNEAGSQRSGAQIANEIFLNDGKLVDFGRNNLHNQSVSINFKPILPNIGSFHRFVEITGSFNTIYNWNDPLQPNPEVRDLAKDVNYNSSIRINMPIRLKAAADHWFGIGTMVQSSPAEVARLRQQADTTQNDKPKKEWYQHAGLTLKTIFLDWERIDLIFNQGNSSINTGVYGGNGMTNFWGRGLTFRESQNMFGPSFAYQMGLVSNPHGGFKVSPSDNFPFFGFDTYRGLRPPNGIMQDNFRQQTKLEARTSRPLWDKATLEINWSSELGYNRNHTVTTDETGIPVFTNVFATESFNRTFLTFPSIFGFNLFNNTIERVVELFEAQRDGIVTSEMDTVQKNKALQRALNEAFYEGLEAFSFTSGKAGKFLPSMNWAFRWEGLEEYKIWMGLITRMSVEHRYTSTYQENVQITNIGRAVQSQTVQYGFQPLFRVNSTFDEEIMKGLLTASVSWNFTQSYQLNSVARSTVSSQSTNEITAQGSYTRRGFEIELLGFSLPNDLEYSFQFTYKRNRRATFDVLNQSSFEGGNDNKGRTLDGNTQIIVEPRARYSVSNRLTASLFVRYEGTFSEGAGTPGFHTTQVGFDLRLSLAGGR